ncbi:Sec-independent protein translocase protein TatB [Novosphingobium album (ex Liu et al. 2023)]|uniref:Sec-independent protein translocase protein TatB n=1 Tax=Novosphingobium album (ex Liu et al. 2023) TaxID=3031130 RepID=A0ABT5WKY5_9SPHN|nr:Sec-independent protein translocase protein TatB [Novosphingobium album (ex Liu et al. 2023)]MDE8650381.1 Sec-independent protein translocase protein TatB [Novosphingobium album (ex Liu et al. 2023)]
MFDVGASELLMIVIVAVVVIGPKDMPMALRTAGRWIGKMRRLSGHFRAGIDAMVRDAELEDMERKWREQNDAIMKAHPVLPDAEAMQPPIAAAADATPSPDASARPAAEPLLPLPPP